MATVEEELAAVQVANLLEEGMIAAGTDLLDINAPPSVLLSDTVRFVSEKLNWERERLALQRDFEEKLQAVIVSRETLNAHGYPARKVFQITPEVAEDLRIKQEAMKRYSDELVVPPLLADKLEVIEKRVA